MRSGRRTRSEHGFVYIGLLIGLAVIGIGLGATSQVWTQMRQREKEQELIFIGNQYRQAISHFYSKSPPAARRFPMTMDELVEDVRTPDKPARHLRRLYEDPITNTREWGEVRLANGQIVGVYSLSNDKPIKVFGFALRDKTFLDKDRYSDWIFRSTIPAANPVLAAGTGYQGAAPGTAAPTPVKPPPVARPDNAPPPPGVILPAPRAR